MAQNYEESKITYQQIVMKQIMVIQKICSKELKDGEKIIKNLIGEQIIEGEDTRHSYLQSVELMGSLLFPYFPAVKKEGEENVISEFEDFCNILDMQLVDAMESEEFKKELVKFFNVKDVEEIKCQEKLGIQANVYFLDYKIKLARRLFRSLVNLFKDQDFLNSESYGESSSEVDNGLEAVIDDGEVE